MSGHFWSRFVEMPNLDRWRYEVVDYQANVMVEGLTASPAQAVRFVRAWDPLVCGAFDGSGNSSLT